MMSIGQLASRAAISSRTLRFYDQIGLLKPSGRTAAGYRAYTQDEVLRLQQILSLRSLGLSLAEIRAQLESGDPDYRKVVRAHLKHLETEVHHLQNLHARLTRLDEILSREGELVTEDLLRIIEGISMLDKHVPAAEYERLQKRHEELGDSRGHEARKQWASLVAEWTRLQKEGASAAGEQAQALAEQGRNLLREFTDDDPAAQKALLAAGPTFFSHLGITIDKSVADFAVAALRG